MKIARLTLHILTAIGFVALFCFAKVDYRKSTCVDVKFPFQRVNENAFLTESMMMEALYKVEPSSVVGLERGELDLKKLESGLKKAEYVQDVQVYFNKDSYLIVDVVEQHPILRIINKKGVSYYIDGHGKKMAFSTKFTSRVPVASGYITGDAEQFSELYGLIKLINEKESLAAIVQQIYVNKEGEYEMVTLFGSHSVLLGDLSNLNDKLDRLIAFYKASTGKVDLSNYRQVNLKYTNQIVCKKF